MYVNIRYINPKDSGSFNQCNDMFGDLTLNSAVFWLVNIIYFFKTSTPEAIQRKNPISPPHPIHIL